MTNLKCNVQNCMYNDDKLCSKGDIMIGGRDASKPNETCCESFRERTGSASNSVGHACKKIDVDCEATKCVFNEECKCNAHEIGIGGNNACSCGETECASFECGCK